MFFFNGRIRNAHVVPMLTPDRPQIHKIDYPSIIAGCLVIVIGLILIVIGLISETRKTTFFGTGIISLCLGLCLATFACVHAKLNICYRNWAYKGHVAPSHLEPSQLATADDISISYFTGPTAITKQS